MRPFNLEPQEFAHLDPAIDWIIVFHHQPIRDPDTVHPWGIAVFDLDPGDVPGGQTSISVKFYHTPAATAAALNPAPILFDTFTMTKRRRDGLLADRSGQSQREGF
jgi:hypothetical protein